MNRADKERFVAELRERLKKAKVVYLTDFTGLDVPSITVLRSRLRESGAEYLVVKNRLAKRALADLDDIPDLEEHLVGPTAVVFAYDGPVEPAKAVAEFAREHDDRPVFKVGVLDQGLLEPAQIDRLAKLPPRDQLLAQLAGALEAPMAALAAALEGKLQETVGLVEALRRQKSEAA